MSDSIGTSEAAAILGTSAGWVATLCRQGVLESERGGGRGRPYRIPRSGVEELAAARADPDDLERLAAEIEHEEEEVERAAEAGDESWYDWLAGKAKEYGPGVALAVGGVALGGVLGAAMVAEGVRRLATRVWGDG